MIRIGRLPPRTLLGARPGLGTLPRYEALGDPRAEYVKRKWLTSGEWGCLDNGPKLAVGQPNSSWKKKKKKKKKKNKIFKKKKKKKKKKTTWNQSKFLAILMPDLP